MIIRPAPCPLWARPPADAPERIGPALDRGLDRRQGGEVRLWFRADDTAAASNEFSRIIKIFTGRRVPLALAVVPAWLTKPRAQMLRQLDSRLFTMHMHGWRHVNYEPAGMKKCEFGAARPAADKRADVQKGRGKLAALLGGRFEPVFTPPWNRCDGETLAALADLAFAGVSRTPGAKPAAPAAMREMNVYVDLHTRKEPCPERSLAELLLELENTLAAGGGGVMLHHQLATPTADVFLDRLLQEAAKRPQLLLER